ncbi:hypothetical protein J32TS6_12270 [Virgibacillus pantothenticus]|nr:hypothetical protein [Virgibacillus pantothenticus]GIP62672.1 hypothetical protein J32TS6_12270 [Virgibacillus pantothenticus]
MIGDMRMDFKKKKQEAKYSTSKTEISIFSAHPFSKCLFVVKVQQLR